MAGSISTLIRPARLAARIAFVIGMAAIVVPSLITFDIGDTPGGDKAQHFAAYFLVATAGFVGVKRRNHLWVAAALLALGAILEFAQAAFTNDRHAEFADYGANLAGVGAGWIVGWTLRWLAVRLGLARPEES